MHLQPTYNHYEQFTYDIADRLTMWKVQYPFKTGSYTYTANYSDNGNPDSYRDRKSDFGYYSYSKKTKPHAVSGISSLIAGTGDERTCEAEYNSFGKVSKLTLKNGSTTLKTATFVYGPDGQRRRMSTGNSASTYSGDYQVNRYNGGGEQQLHYISGPAGLCALIVRNYNCGKLISCTIYHLQTDYQGSIIAAYNSNGTLYKHFSYDPWGRRRVGGAWDNCLVATETLITRGYCGHEHLDDFGTINMNGRIYDPRLGRFLSPDPYVQAPYNSQNYNRYSYCLNNPLKYTDPSGKLFKELLSVISVPIAFVSGTTNWIINGGSFRNGFSETYKGWRNYGKTIDNKIFHNGAATAKNSITASSPYATGTPHIFVASNGDIYEGYYFETLYDMSNFMWYKSEEIGIEISAYILRDDNGKDYYWVNDWKGNYPEHCENPHYLQAGKKGVRMDNKRIVAEFHTHPSVNFTGDKENVYDGPSYNDYFISVQLGIPVYTIGSTSVSRIYWETSEYKTQEDFNKLAVIQNKYDMRSLVPSLFVNPFSIGRRNDWLKNPYYQEPFWWH